MSEQQSRTFPYMTNEDISQFSKSINETFQPIIDNIEKHSQSVAPLLKKARMWYFPSMPVEIYTGLTSFSKDTTVEQIEQLFIDFYDKNGCKELRLIVTSWFDDSAIYTKRRQIIEDALDSHIAGKFTLSIPALLPQIEGILSDNLGIKAGKLGKLLKSAVSENDLKDAKTFKTLRDDILVSLSADPFFINEEGLGESFTSEKYNDWMKSKGISGIPLNRNTILHGIQIDYGTKANSLRVFFLLDSIHWIYSDIRKIIMNEF
jgi:hypothetical protein